MEFQEFAKEYNRMCKAHPNCYWCPFDSHRNSCNAWIMDNPEKAEEIVAKWADGNPITTNRKKFEEVFGCKLFSFKPSNTDRAIENCMKWLDEEYKAP